MPLRSRRPDAVRRRLLAWYDATRRDLPFRRSTDPYAIWVAEIMLQQTTVQAAVPYWRRFRERFPTIDALAGAQLDDVLAVWAGLGYYRRARHLHRTAQLVCAEHAGVLPRTASALQRLPGIGPYTAAAVASIAFGEATPAIDGNVQRVLARLHAVEGVPREQPARGRLAELAAALIDPDRPGDFNQALMELGATVCRAAAPECARCPLRSGCRARREGRIAELPSPARRPSTVSLHRIALLVERGSAAVLVRRAEMGEHNAGLWELPWVGRPQPPLTGRRADRAPLARLRRSFPWLPGKLAGIRRLGCVRHSITRHRITVDLFLVPSDVAPETPEGGDWRWIDPADDRPGLTAASRKLLALRPQPR